MFGRKKRNGPLTSTFGPIKTGLILHRISKLCKFVSYVSSPSFVRVIFLIFSNSKIRWLNFWMLKDEQNYSYNGVWDAKLLKNMVRIFIHTVGKIFVFGKTIVSAGRFSILWTLGICRAIFDFMEFLEIAHWNSFLGHKHHFRKALRSNAFCLEYT